jgi:hypothetical protein
MNKKREKRVMRNAEIMELEQGLVMNITNLT